jgi:hypothetical protein
MLRALRPVAMHLQAEARREGGGGVLFFKWGSTFMYKYVPYKFIMYKPAT